MNQLDEDIHSFTLNSVTSFNHHFISRIFFFVPSFDDDEEIDCQRETLSTGPLLATTVTDSGVGFKQEEKWIAVDIWQSNDRVSCRGIGPRYLAKCRKVSATEVEALAVDGDTNCTLRGKLSCDSPQTPLQSQIQFRDIPLGYLANVPHRQQTVSVQLSIRFTRDKDTVKELAIKFNGFKESWGLV